MEPDPLIPIEVFCTHHQIEITFVNALQQFGLIEITVVDERKFIALNQLNELEKFVRLHYEMDINLEGVEAISHLLRRVETMQQEITNLKNRLRLYDVN